MPLTIRSCLVHVCVLMNMQHILIHGWESNYLRLSLQFIMDYVTSLPVLFLWIRGSAVPVNLKMCNSNSFFCARFEPIV